MKFMFNSSKCMCAMHVILEFFNYMDVRAAREHVEIMLECATAHHFYKKRAPWSIYYFGIQLKKLLPACFVLADSCGNERGFVRELNEAGCPDLLRCEDYIMSSHVKDIWNFIPRHLSAKQYRNPVKILQKVKQYRRPDEWEDMVNEFIEFSLSNSAMMDEDINARVIRVQKILLQCIEACYLMAVRYRFYIKQDELSRKTPQDPIVSLQE